MQPRTAKRVVSFGILAGILFVGLCFSAGNAFALEAQESATLAKVQTFSGPYPIQEVNLFSPNVQIFPPPIAREKAPVQEISKATPSRTILISAETEKADLREIQNRLNASAEAGRESFEALRRTAFLSADRDPVNRFLSSRQK